MFKGKMKLTVICREEGYNEILLYTVVADPENDSEVQEAVQAERNADLDNEANDMEILFAFAGDVSPVADWRN